MSRKEDIRGGIKELAIGTSVGVVMKILGKGLHYEFLDESGVFSEEKSAELPYIFAFWHNSIFALGSGYRVLSPDMKMACLTSASKDGAMIKTVMDFYGVHSIRGSSSRRGKKAIVEMLKALKEGYSLSITPDGPRGPLHKLNPGVLRLASHSQRGLVPVQVEYSSYWELPTWDKFRIPKPFSTVRVFLNAPIMIPDNLSPEEEEEYRTNIEQTLISPINYTTGKVYAEHRW